MSRFRALADFENRFEKMGVEELQVWRRYWTKHAHRGAPTLRKDAMKIVFKIDAAIARKEVDE